MEMKKIDDLKATMYWLAVNCQQNFYEVSSDWNKYEHDEHIYLKNYIGYALFGPPNFELLCNDDEDEIYIYKDKGAMELIDQIYDKVVEHGSQINENNEVLCSILFTCIYDESSLLNCDEYNLNEHLFIKPIFKVRKNIKKKNAIEFNNYYIDTEARVYKDWNDYLINNNLPTCTMIVPKDGIYQADLREIWSDKITPVWVHSHSNNRSKKLTNAVDLASTIVNVGCVGIGIAAIFNPISAPIAIAGAVGGAVSGLWGGGRAVGELVDRKTHDQSINIVNKHALPAWLGVAGSTLGLAASSGSALLSQAIRTGTTVGKSAQISHDAIMISNLLVNSVGVGYNSFGMIQKYRETGEVSAKDVFFLTAHLLFICNSAIKMQLASDIIKSDQNQIIKEYEDSLRSNRHRKVFRRLVRNTGSNIVDEVSRNEQIIRTLTKINNKDEFFAKLVQNRKIFASTNTELSFANGHVQINGVTLVNPSNFVSMSKDSILNLVNQASGSNSSSNVQTQKNTMISSNKPFIPENVLKAGVSILKSLCVQQSVLMSRQIKTDENNYTDILSDLQDNPDRSKIFEIILGTAMHIIQKIPSSFEINDILAEITNFIWRYIKFNFSAVLPNFEQREAEYQYFFLKIVKATSDYVKSNYSEWIQAFRNAMTLNIREKTLSNNAQDSSSSMDTDNNLEKKYNNLTLIDPTEVMTLPEEISTMLVQEALQSTGSQMNETAKLPKELIDMCNAELNDFFSKHPTNLDFKLTDLPNELAGILMDLKNFDKKDIIFYKLLVISINIAQGVTDDRSLKKNEFLAIIKCLWIIINMNFSIKMPGVCMLTNEHEGDVINIIISIYTYQIDEPEKWSSAFYEYRRIHIS